MPAGSLIHFGPFELRLETGELLKRGRKLKLPPQSFRLLALLASSPGQLVTRETIQKELWGNNTFVDFEHSLNFCVRQIRCVLGESGKKPRFIETLPRRGYRFHLDGVRHNGQPADGKTSGALANKAVSPTESTERARPAVAVLEFENLSRDATVDWLATGIAETLATDLRILHSVRVVSSDRVRAMMEQTSREGSSTGIFDYNQLGKRLAAEWIVRGSYQRDGHRLRVISQLYEVQKGELASAHKVDGTWRSIFRLQDQVARQLVEALGITVSGKEQRRISKLTTGYVEAYEEYSKGRRKLFEMGKGTLDEALVYFRRALALDPEYVMPHSGLGAALSMRFIHRSDPDDMLQAREHLELVLARDPELAEPYPWLCYIYMREGKLQDALDAGKRAVQLVPDFIPAHYFLALVYFVSCECDPGNYGSAANHLLHAARIHPRWQATWFVLSFLCLLNGNYPRAEEFAKRLLELNADSRNLSSGPGFVGAEVLLGMVALRRGEFEAAVAWFTQSLDVLYKTDHMYRDGMRTLSACGLGDTCLRQGKPAQALTHYHQAWQIAQEYPTMLAQDRHTVRVLAGLAAAYAATGDNERAALLLSQALAKLETAKTPQSSAAGANLAELYYAVTVAHLRAGNTQAALEALENSILAGWLDRGWLEQDPELSLIRTLPRFEELLLKVGQFPIVQVEL